MFTGTSTTSIIVDEYVPCETIECKITDEALAHGHDPVLTLSIAKCESEVRQFDENGDVLRGIQNPKDIGVFQINEKYHLDDSIKIGFDIYTVDGNIAYAMHLLDTQGTRPWNWSKNCWGETIPSGLK